MSSGSYQRERLLRRQEERLAVNRRKHDWTSNRGGSFCKRCGIRFTDKETVKDLGYCEPDSTSKHRRG